MTDFCELTSECSLLKKVGQIHEYYHNKLFYFHIGDSSVQGVGTNQERAFRDFIKKNRKEHYDILYYPANRSRDGYGF
jgi:hypothetical protein